MAEADIPLEFPERPMALGNFLKGLRRDLAITMFHYRNHGAGKLLLFLTLLGDQC